MHTLKAITLRQTTTLVHPRSYLHQIRNTCLENWIHNLWRYCAASNMPDEVGYRALQIYTSFLNCKTTRYTPTKWVKCACIWIACKMYFDESETAYMFVRRARVLTRRNNYAHYTKKLIKEEAKIANKLNFRFSQPLAIDFVNVLTDMLGIDTEGQLYKRIVKALKQLTTIHTIEAKPLDIAVDAIVSCDPTMKEAVDALVAGVM